MDNTKQLIRGARIVQQMENLTEAPYAELEQKTMQFTPTTTKRQYAIDPIRVTKMELTPAAESQILSAKSVVSSEGTNYTTTISFDNVIYDQDDQATNVSFKAVTGDEHHIQKIDLRKVNCKVSCNCLDFYWRFATQNSKVNSLDGKAPPPYHKKTDRPPVNLKNTPGVCKHIMKTVIALRDAGIVN